MSSHFTGKCPLCCKAVLVTNFKRHCKNCHNSINNQEKYEKLLVKFETNIDGGSHCEQSSTKNRTLRIRKINSDTPSTTNIILGRELRSRTSSSISFQTQTENTNRYRSNDRTKPTTTSTPILGRKVIKPSLRRRKSVKTSSGSSKTKKTVRLAENNDRNGSSDEMDQDYTEQTTASNFGDQVISNSTTNNNPVNQDQNQNETDVLNVSNESVDEDHQIKRTTVATRKDIMNYFIKQPDGGFKCALCTNSNKVFSKTNENSDSNLRSHLEKMHRMTEFFCPSKKNQHQPKPKLIDNEEKKQFHNAAIEAIIKDDLPFNHFRKGGIAKFLSIIKPGYHGPNRKFIRKHLTRLYKQRRDLIKERLSSVLNISLATDVWKSPTRQYFICLTCHFLTSTYENESFVLSFRRFPDKYAGKKLRSFINNELRKMNLGSKVRSITTDSGPDIKCATTGVAGFGIRISCCAHNLNLVVKNALWLFKTKSPKNSTSSSTSTSSKQNNDVNDNSDDETSSFYDSEEIFEQDISEYDYNSDGSDENDFTNDSNITYISSDEELSDSIDEDEHDDGNITEGQSLLQSDDSNQPQNHEEIIAELVSDPISLKLTMYNVLQRVRILIKLIRKSYPLDSYVRQQIQFKKIVINRRIEGQNTKSFKLNDIIMDFRIRWNTTYVMLERFIAISAIITDITLSPSIQIGLKKPQYEKLRKSSFSRFDWLCLVALKNVLYPFYVATTLLSESKYPTLSLSFSVLLALKTFLATNKNDHPLESALKELFLIEFKYYFEQQTSWEQERATLIAALLNPTVYSRLNDENILEAEQVLLSEFDIQSFDRLQINTSATTTNSMYASASPQYPVISNSTTRQEGTSLDEFYRVCGMSLPSNVSTTSINKQLSFKEELCYYMSTAGSYSSFSLYWCQHEALLPQLSKFVKRFCCIPATSVPSEAAFSVAGHIQRKSRASLSSTTLRYLMILRN